MAKILKIEDLIKKLDSTIAVLNAEIDNYEAYIQRNAASDPVAVKETTDDMAKLNTTINRYQSSKRALQKVANFTKKNDFITGHARIHQIQHERNILQQQLDDLDDKIDTCNINADVGIYDAAQCKDYKRDAAQYLHERARIAADIAVLDARLASFKR